MFRKEKLGGGDRGRAGRGRETGEQDTWTEGPPREHRCASHRATKERTLLSQAEVRMPQESVCLWAHV